MSFLKPLPQISVPLIESGGLDESFLAEEFVDRPKARLREMQRDLAEHEQPDAVAFLPSDRSISVEVVGYANPALVTYDGRELGSGRACTLLTHQSSIQALVSIESIPSCSNRLRKNFVGTPERHWPARLEQEENAPAGCSKRPSSKAAASEGPRRTLWGTLRV